MHAEWIPYVGAASPKKSPESARVGGCGLLSKWQPVLFMRGDDSERNPFCFQKVDTFHIHAENHRKYPSN